MADVAIENNSSQFEPKFTDLELEHPVEGDITIPGAQDEEGDPSTLDEPVIDTIMRDVSAVGKKFLHVLYPRKSKSLLKDWDLWGPLILCTLMAVLLHLRSSGAGGADDDSTKQLLGFSQVFSLLAFGAVTVAVNSKLLGGTISFFQSVCVLGYCILPLVFSLILGMTIHIVTETSQSGLLFGIRVLLTIAGCVWSTLGCVWPMLGKRVCVLGCRILPLVFSLIIGMTIQLITQTSNSSLLFGIRVLLTIVGCVWTTLASVAFLADSQPQHRRVLAVYPICLFYFVVSWMVLTGE